MVKKGDTLIEVTLAIGIFSMVAIAVVSVMNGGVSKSETALETTLTREEIDTQADALRFIHDAYMAGNQTIGSLWNTITQEDNLGTSPIDSCGSLDGTNAFFLDVSKLFDSEQVNDVYQKIKYTGDESEDNYKPANDYPQINESKAEGIYIIGKAASQEAQVFDGTDFKKGSIYYDFRIQTCWYGVGEDISSTISTVVRLNNPEFAKITGNTTPSSGGSGGSGGGTPTPETPETPETSPIVTIEYNSNGGSGTTTGKKLSNESDFNSYRLSSNNFTAPNPDTQEFNGWCINDNSCSSPVASRTYLKNKISYPTSDTTITIYAQWKDKSSTPPSNPTTLPDPVPMTEISNYNDLLKNLSNNKEVNLSYNGNTYIGKKYNSKYIWMMSNLANKRVNISVAESDYQCPTNWRWPNYDEVARAVATDENSWAKYGDKYAVYRNNNSTNSFEKSYYTATQANANSLTAQVRCIYEIPST